MGREEATKPTEMAEELLEKSERGKETRFDEITAVRTPRDALRRLQSLLNTLLKFDVSILSFWSEDSKEAQLYVALRRGSDSPTLCRIPASSPPEFRLIDGSLVAVSNPDDRSGVTQITTVFSDKDRYVQSGLTVPIETRSSQRTTLVLASHTESLVGRRKVFDDVELKRQLREVVEGIDPTGEFPALDEDRRLSYEAVFHRLSTPVAVVSDDGTIHVVNGSFESISGYSQNDLADRKTLFEIIHPKDRHRLASFLSVEPEPESAAVSIPPLECTLLARDGSEHVMLATRSSLSDGRLVITLNEVTRYKEHEIALRDWVQRIEAINKITSAVSSSLNFEELFATVCEHIREIIDYDVACLALRSEVDAAGRLRVRLCDKGETQVTTVTLERFARFLERQGNTILGGWDDADADLVRGLLGPQVKSFLILPLILNGEPEGCFAVGSHYADAFSSYHTAVLRGAAAQLAIAVHKTRMVQEMQRHLSNLNQLSRTSAAITGTLELSGVVAQMVQAVEHILSPRLVWVESVRRGDLVPLGAGRGTSGETVLQPVPLTPAIERFLRSDIPIQIPNLATDDTLPEARRQALLAAGVEHLVVFPIRGQGIGPVLLWIGRDALHSFTRSDLELIATLVSHASVAIANAYLYNEVRETRNYLQNVIESSIDAIVTVDRAGRITFVGKGGQETFGYREKEIVGQPIWNFWVGGEKLARRLQRELAKKQGKVIDHHLEVYRADGARVPVSLSISKIRNHRGQTVGYLGIAKDMTDQRRAEEEIRRKSEELENFVYLISHNLKAPIVSVQGFASLLMSEGNELEESQRLRYLDRILKNVLHMQEMIHDLLEFSKIGRIERRRRKVDLGELVAALAEEMRLQLMQKNITLRVAEDLPEVHCDREGMNAVFSNLLSNAIKYIGDTDDPLVEVGWEDKGRFYTFWVRDNGIGIEPRYQEKVFDLFQRGSATHEVEGTGVGLAIVRRIVENHGGMARIASEPGSGTTVYFTLPKRRSRPS